MKNVDRRTIVLRVNPGEEDLLLQDIAGVNIVHRQLYHLAKNNWRQIIIMLPLAADKLRAEIQRIAVWLPVRIATINIEDGYPWWTSLQYWQMYLPEKFVIGRLLDLTVSFVAEELIGWEGDLVLGASDKNYGLDLGQVHVMGRYIDRVAEKIKNGKYLIGTDLYTKEFLLNLPEQVSSKLDIDNLMTELVRERAAKVCEFAGDEKWPQLLMKDKPKILAQKRWQLAQNFIAEMKDNSEEVEMTPTVRNLGKLVAGKNVQIGEYVILRGENYLGDKVKVEDFCVLENVCVEAGNVIETYTKTTNHWQEKGV